MSSTLMDAINQARLRVWNQQPDDLLRRGDHRRRRHARRPPTPSARKAWTSPTTAPGATIRWSSRWPTRPGASVPGQPRRQPAVARDGRQLPRTGPSTLCRQAGFRGSSSAATPTSPRPSTWTAGTPRPDPVPVRHRRQAQPDRPGRRPARIGVRLSGTSADASGNHAPAATRAAQAADRPRPRLQDAPHAPGAGRRVRRTGPWPVTATIA